MYNFLKYNGMLHMYSILPYGFLRSSTVPHDLRQNDHGMKFAQSFLQLLFPVPLFHKNHFLQSTFFRVNLMII